MSQWIPEKQVIVIFAGTQGYADDVPLERMRAWELALLRYMELDIQRLALIFKKKRITDENSDALRAALEDFYFHLALILIKKSRHQSDQKENVVGCQRIDHG